MSNDKYLEKPRDWQDPADAVKSWDTSQIRKYTDRAGLEFWMDPFSDGVSTNDPKIFLSIHQYYAQDYAGHSFAKLHFDDGFVVMTKHGKDLDTIAFSPDYAERTTEGEQIWHIDRLFETLRLPDNEAYPWVDMAGLLPKVEVKGMAKFRSLSQQNRFIYLAETLLSCHNGSLASALRGGITKGKVVFGKELMTKFNSGILYK